MADPDERCRLDPLEETALQTRPELRSLRLQLDYLEPELRLQDAGILETIVVFGSARLSEPGAAQRDLQRAKRALARDPQRVELRAAVTSAERACRFSHYYDVAREFGRIVGRAGGGPDDNRLALATGGGRGAMEAANRGARDVGANSIGLNIRLPREQLPNGFITPGLCFQFRYFAIRKLHFMLRARAFVAFPGGYGTLDELFETLCLVQTGKREPLPIVLVGAEFWNAVVDFEALRDAGMIEQDELELFSRAEEPDEIWQNIADWYTTRGRSIFE